MVRINALDNINTNVAPSQVLGTTGLVDHHKRAIAAAERGQARELSEAVRLDIHEGMQLIAEALKDQDAAGAGGPLPARRRRAV